MYDLIPPYGTLQDVFPGDTWQPEPAARYNAVNELLRQEHFSPPQFPPPTGNDCLLSVCNVSGETLPIYSPVQLDTSFADGDRYRCSSRNVFALGKPVENEYSIWGVALENIPPGRTGAVQMAGVVLIHEPVGDFEYEFRGRTVRNNFIFPGRDGRYHFGQRGGAEVIWYCRPNSCVLVRLGAKDHQYTGMFAVLENGDGTLTVKGGETDLHPTYTASLSFRGNGFIEDTLLPVEGDPYTGRMILLTATLSGETWDFDVVSTDSSLTNYYIPGEMIYWEIARYASVDNYGYLRDFQQLHQGGVIHFRDRYYVQ